MNVYIIEAGECNDRSVIGVYEGKMWKRLRMMVPETWDLIWFDKSAEDPTACQTHDRQIVIVEFTA